MKLTDFISILRTDVWVKLKLDNSPLFSGKEVCVYWLKHLRDYKKYNSYEIESYLIIDESNITVNLRNKPCLK